MTIIGTKQELDLLLETLASSGYCKGIPCEECIFEKENCSKLKNCVLIYTDEESADKASEQKLPFTGWPG